MIDVSAPCRGWRCREAPDSFWNCPIDIGHFAASIPKMDRDVEPRAEDYSAEYPFVRLMQSHSHPFEDFKQVYNESLSNPIFSEVDERIQRICKAYLAGSKQQRTLLRAQIQNGMSLLHYCSRMAIRAMRTTDDALLDLAGAALSIEDVRTDWRESISELAILYHVATKIGANWKSYVRKLTGLSAPLRPSSSSAPSKIRVWANWKCFYCARRTT